MNERLFKARVLENTPASPGYMLISLECLEDIKRPIPGQFFMIRLCSGNDPLLRRAFSLHAWIGKNRFQILYRIKGIGTKILSEIQKGQTIDVLGPLGNGFPKRKAERHVLVAGGIGIAPLIGLAETMDEKDKLSFFMGFRTKTEAICLDRVNKMAASVSVATEDGSLGQKGTVIDILNKNLNNIKSTIIYACGPRNMLKRVSDVALRHAIDAYLSMEEYMACGLGSCLGCVIRTTQGYKRVCKEGPIFDHREIVW